jgi:transcriptional regulator with XRE-family HTH domain
LLSIEQVHGICYDNYENMANIDTSTRVRNRIKTIRLKKKLSQGDIAKILGVHSTYISQIERGIRNPTLKNIEKIAKALNTSIDNLIK